MQLVSTITCPVCGHRASEAMPTDACMFFYVCKGCGTRGSPRSTGKQSLNGLRNAPV